MAYWEFSLYPLITNTHRKKTVHVFENTLKTGFYKFSPNESGHLAVTTSPTAPCAAVQLRCISFQNFAFCENGDRLQSPTARLGCRIICTTFEFAQKKDTRPVGGRGISAFLIDFLFPRPFKTC